MKTMTLSGLFEGRRPVHLQEAGVPPDLRVLVLAPHPDDFDAIGVSMRLLHKNGNRIDVGVVTSGASGVEDGFGGVFSAEEKEKIREDEQIRSARFFGLPDDRLAFLRLAEDENGDPVDSAANQDVIRSYILLKRPDLVFLPHWNDTNRGHQLNHVLFKKAVDREKLPLVACLNEDPKTRDIRRDICMVFDDAEAEWKRKLLRHHRSQQERNLKTRGHGFDDRILTLNRRAAETLGMMNNYAEIFEVEKYGV